MEYRYGLLRDTFSVKHEYGTLETYDIRRHRKTLTYFFTYLLRDSLPGLPTSVEQNSGQVAEANCKY